MKVVAYKNKSTMSLKYLENDLEVPYHCLTELNQQSNSKSSNIHNLNLIFESCIRE